MKRFKGVKKRVHSCCGPGCCLSIPLNLMMCDRHWAMVPFAIKAKVWNTYRKGQKVDVRISDPEYIAAKELALGAILVKYPPL